MKLKVTMEFRYRRFVLDEDGRWTYNERGEPIFDMVYGSRINFVCESMTSDETSATFWNPVMEDGGLARHLKDIGAQDSVSIRAEFGSQLMDICHSSVEMLVVQPIE